MKKILFTTEQRIIHTLMMRTLNSNSLGLFNGKMGVAITFYHYYRYTGKQIYERYAYELVDSVLNSVIPQIDISLSTGLIGIGWGIEYLLQNDFVEGDAAEICEHIDERIMLYDPRRMSDSSLDDLVHYILIHCKSRILFDAQYITDIQNAVSCCRDIPFSVAEQVKNYEIDISKFVVPIDISDGIFHTKPIGIHGGLSGVLMQKYVAL